VHPAHDMHVQDSTCNLPSEIKSLIRACKGGSLSNAFGSLCDLRVALMRSMSVSGRCGIRLYIDVAWDLVKESKLK